MRSVGVSAFLMITTTVLAATACAEDYKIEIARTKSESGLIHGEIRVNGVPMGASFENADLKIPSGSYAGVLRYWSGHNFVQGPFGALGRQGDFLLEVSGVLGRSAILLHAGNKPHHSKGCILLGPARRDPGGGATIDASHPLYKMRQEFYGTQIPNSTPNKSITITIYD